jgi:predicted amino acid dehydrogenase
MGKDLRDAEVAIIGASGSIGSACTRILSREVRHINLVARRIGPLEDLAQELNGHGQATFSVSSDVKRSLHKADVVIAVTSAVDFIIDPADLKSGAVVCDVARPRNVSRNVSALRNDVLVIEGGVIHVPGNVDFRFNFGFPPHTCFACMAETMILALEGRYENFTLGRKLNPSQIDTISVLARKHGFTLAGFRNFEHAVTPEMIEKIKGNVKL